MVVTATDYLRSLQALLPQGLAWTREDDANLTLLLLAFADEFARVDARAMALVDEADPRTTFELLADWERVAGLPDSCVVVEQNIAQRRAALVARLTTVGGQTAAYLVALAAANGYTITISEYDFLFDVTDLVDALVYGYPWQFAFKVQSALLGVFELSVSDGVSDALATWSNTGIECIINRYKPAHTLAVFTYI